MCLFTHEHPCCFEALEAMSNESENGEWVVFVLFCFGFFFFFFFGGGQKYCQCLLPRFMTMEFV